LVVEDDAVVRASEGERVREGERAGG